MRKKVAIRVALVAAIFGGVFGLADALNLTTQTLGAADTVVAACQSATFNATWAPTYLAGQPGYQETSVLITGITAPCESKAFKVTLAGAGGSSLGEITGTTPGALGTWTGP